MVLTLKGREAVLGGINKMDFAKMLPTLPSMKRGQGALGLFMTIAFGMAGIVILLYTLLTLSTALNNTWLTIIVNNTVQLFVNFTTQFGTLGTLGGVGLFFVAIGAVALWGYNKYRGGGGSGM